MAGEDFVPIAGTETDPLAPLIASLMKRYADNHLAVSQMAPSAITNGAIAYAGWHPYDLETGGDGLIYDHAVDGTLTTVETPLLLTGFSYQLRFTGLTHNHGASARVQIDVQDTLSQWSPSSASGKINPGTPVGETMSASLQILRMEKVRSFYFLGNSLVSPASSTGTEPNDELFNPLVDATLQKFRFAWDNGDMTGGTIHLDRVGEYIGR